MPFSECDVHRAMVSKVYAYRVRIPRRRSTNWRPASRVHKIGGHSKGLQCVRVKTKRGYVVLASDCAHLYSHIDEGRVFPITYNVGRYAGGLQDNSRSSPRRAAHIVPGHDPEVLELYPAAKRQAGKVGSCRLDVEPKA